MAAVTVLIAAYNAEATIGETLTSLAGQTFPDFDVLVIDDASSDATPKIVADFSNRLSLRLITLDSNLGVAGALNRGLAEIETALIARLDADDLAMPERLEKQVAFMSAEPNIDVCGTAMEMFYDAGNMEPRILAKPTNDSAIKTALVQYSALSHGSAIFRKSFFDDIGPFDGRFDFAEDYDLWCRGALLGKHYANLSEPLTRYRQHAAQVGQQKRQLQYERDMAIKRKYISALLGGASPGFLPEIFSLITSFINRDTALMVIQQSIPLLFHLGKKINDENLYHQIVSSCIGRHLANSE